jgi:hypothetical protein
MAHLDVTGRIAFTLLRLAKQPMVMTHPDACKSAPHAPGDRQDRRLLARDGGADSKRTGAKQINYWAAR